MGRKHTDQWLRTIEKYAVPTPALLRKGRVRESYCDSSVVAGLRSGFTLLAP